MTNSPKRRVACSTYRIQLSKQFTFRQATERVPYWNALGVTDLYASPLLMSRPGSVHGYDVIDHTRLNPEIGTEDDLRLLHEALAARQMGLLIDIVPNHMCVSTNDNEWWNDVLENGPSSPYAKFFDIDWRPPKAELRDKVLLPVLADQYGRILEGAELQIAEADGALTCHYNERRFPIGPGTYAFVLEAVVELLRGRATNDEVGFAHLESIVTAALALPDRSETEPEKVRERQREKEIIKGRLRALLAEHAAVRAAMDEALRALNGTKGDPRSFDRLEELLAKQAYRLSFWRVAGEQINYRRFFEINDLAAIRIEEPEVLKAVHAKPFELLARGWATGLRVDHVDGLREPKRYLEDLQERAGGPYVVVEKILGPEEALSPTWATEGTTGYEFLNQVNGLFVSSAGERPLRALYDALRTVRGRFADILVESKRLILKESMSSELSVLARRLDRISEQHRWSRDFTIGALQRVLTDTIACFPVYRTYVSEVDTEVSPDDVAQIRIALSAAKRRSAAASTAAFDFLGEVLLMRDPDGLSDEDRAERRDFILRFQQLTGPVMAKGLEDTTFFRYFPLLSLNEVGGGPERFGLTVAEFHERMKERAKRRPEALSASSTHDTKRGEDNRARLNVLSEIPDEWAAVVAEWWKVADPLKPRVDGVPAPDPDDEYYIYQTLVGVLPTGELDDNEAAQLTTRVQGAVEKSIREAKRTTSWINPNAPYEDATRVFVARLLDPQGPFMPKLRAFVSRLTVPGLMNGLSQLSIKLTAPGVPDFFQGTELWDFSMLDPDNRRPVDFALRARLLEEVHGSAVAGDLVEELLKTAHDGRIKLVATNALLTLRRREVALFARGTYVPLQVVGRRADNLIAFARAFEGRLAITIAGRFFTQIADGPDAPQGGWGDTAVQLPSAWRDFALSDVMTGQARMPNQTELNVHQVLGRRPFAVLAGAAQMD
ncbi:MAG: malto-oligosyltrehalose synthase [Myxococcota bacterium]|nr:malto-oligosyltrehalose synthase [Myxococcota bacterium]